MLYSFAECRKKYGSSYQIEKAIEERSLFKMSCGDGRIARRGMIHYYEQGLKIIPPK